MWGTETRVLALARVQGALVCGCSLKNEAIVEVDRTGGLEASGLARGSWEAALQIEVGMHRLLSRCRIPARRVQGRIRRASLRARARDQALRCLDAARPLLPLHREGLIRLVVAPLAQRPAILLLRFSAFLQRDRFLFGTRRAIPTESILWDCLGLVRRPQECLLRLRRPWRTTMTGRPGPLQDMPPRDLTRHFAHRLHRPCKELDLQTQASTHSLNQRHRSESKSEPEQKPNSAYTNGRGHRHREE